MAPHAILNLSHTACTCPFNSFKETLTLRHPQILEILHLLPHHSLDPSFLSFPGPLYLAVNVDHSVVCKHQYFSKFYFTYCYIYLLFACRAVSLFSLVGRH